MTKIFYILLLMFGLVSCNHDKNVQTKTPFQLIAYKDLKGLDSFICVFLTDTIYKPAIIKLKQSDSIFVFVPTSKFKTMNLILGADCLAVIQKITNKSLHFKFEQTEFKKSKSLKTVPEMYCSTGKIAGALWCTDSSGYFRIFLMNEANYR